MGWINDLWREFFGQREPGPMPDPEPYVPPDSAAVVIAINAQRRQHWLPELAIDPRLTSIASSWARVMADMGILSHGRFATRIAAVYPARAGAEDIAEGQPTVYAVVQAWMDDPPHRANILGDYNRAGAGIARDRSGMTYWCVDFAKV